MKIKGFTLAEVLITLVIIGVIAAMTVPTLMNNTNEEEFRTGLKKAISAVNQALTLHYALDGLTAQDYATSEDLVNGIFKQRMNIMGETGVDDFTYGCDNGTVFTTMDGMIYCVGPEFHSDASDTPNSSCDFLNTTACTHTGEGPNLWIDVNGEKKPNKLTTNSDHPRDIYIAQIFAQKVVPFGYPTQEVMYNKKVKLGDSEETNKETNAPKDSEPEETGLVPETPIDNEDENIEQPSDLPENIQDLKDNLENMKEGDDSPYKKYWKPRKWPKFSDFLRWMWNTFVKPWLP